MEKTIFPREFVEWIIRKAQRSELSINPATIIFLNKVYTLDEVYKYWRLENLKPKKMKANELRIGNWVLIPYQNSPIAIPAHETQVQGITIFGEIQTNNTPEHEGLKTHYNHVSGIPLTEEWLLKFGFNNINSKEYGIKCGSCWMSLSNPKDMGEWQDCYCWIFDRFKFIELKYVHQLQNLYFALTKEELEIIK